MNESKHLITTDVLIIGGGAAAAQAAITAGKFGIDVTIVDKGKFGRSGSTPSAGGGIRAVYGEAGDPQIDPELNYQFNVKAGDYLCDQDLSRCLVGDEITQRIIELEYYGVKFMKRGNKFIHHGHGAKAPLHTMHASVMGQGFEMMSGMRKEALNRGARLFERIMVTKILLDRGRVIGAIGVNMRDGGIYVFQSKAIILATGSATSLYPYTTSFDETTGDGFALAFDIGTNLVDMEFVLLYTIPIVNGRAIRSPNGFFHDINRKYYNGLGEEMKPPSKIFQAIPGREGTDVLGFRRGEPLWQEIKEGRGPIYADGRKMDWSKVGSHEIERPATMARARAWKLDKRKFEYAIGVINMIIGGVYINKETETNIPGLFAVGEVTGGVHGAYRVAGNGLAEPLVFGDRAGSKAVRYAIKSSTTSISDKKVEGEIGRIKEITKSNKKGISPQELKKNIEQIMFEKVGYDRTETKLKMAVEELNRIKNGIVARELKLENMKEKIQALELHNLSLTGLMVAKSALERKESRGTHNREDYPERDNKNWLKHIALRKKEDDMELFSLPVKIIDMKPVP